MADRHYLFFDEITGEEFIVGAPNKAAAEEIANSYFGLPCFLYKVSEFEAEASGLDEY